MPRSINYSEVARAIRIYHAQHVNNVTLKTFVDAIKSNCKGHVKNTTDHKPNKAEAIRLFEYYLNIEHKLRPITKTKFSFNCHQDYFTPDAVRDIFLNYDIQSRFGRQPSNDIILKNLGVQPTEPIETIEPEEKSYDFSELSDEELAHMADAIRFEQEIRAKRAKLNLILKTADVSRDELIELLKI